MLRSNIRAFKQKALETHKRDNLFFCLQRILLVPDDTNSATIKLQCRLGLAIA